MSLPLSLPSSLPSSLSLRPRRRPFAGAAPWVAALAILLSCDAPAAPREAPEDSGSFKRDLPVNSVATGTLRPGDVGRYVVHAARDQRFEVLVEARSGDVFVEVRAADSAYVTGAHAAADGRPLGAHASDVVPVTRAAAYVVSVWGDGAYRLQAYVADPAPEIAARRFAIGDTVATETLYAPSDVDEFTFRAAKGDSLVVLAQALDAASPGTVTFGVRDAAGAALPAGGSASTATGSLAQGAGRVFAVPTDGDYTLRVTSASLWTLEKYTGPYRLQLRRHDGRPERTPQALLAGSTVVTEAIDHGQDVDDFVLTGAPGALYNVLLQAPPGDAGTALRVEALGAVTDGAPADPPVVVSTGRDSLLTDRGTGRFALPASGRVTVRVTAPEVGRASAPYKLRAVAVDERPEGGARTLAPGDSVTGERIEEPGDVDAFALDVPEPTLMNIVLEIAPGPGGWDASLDGLGVQILREGQPAGGAMVAYRAPQPDAPMHMATGNFTMPAGHHRLRVAASRARERSFFGPYRLYAYRIDPRPESAPAVLAVGDTVADAIDPFGDGDVYAFDARRGDHVEVAILGLGEPTPDAVFAASVRRAGSTDILGGAWTPTRGTSLDAHTSERITIPETGRYTLSVSGGDGASRGATARGAYRLALRRYPAGPETHRAEIALGEAVTDERLDVSGDVDEFTVRGTPGALAVGRISRDGATGADATVGLLVELLDPTTKAVLGAAKSYDATAGDTPAVAFPAGGALLVRVYDPDSQWNRPWPLVGAYQLRVVPAPAPGAALRRPR